VEGWTTRSRAATRWSGWGGDDEVGGWTTQRRATTRWSGRGGGATRRLDGDEEQRSGGVVNRTWRGCAGARRRCGADGESAGWRRQESGGGERPPRGKGMDRVGPSRILGFQTTRSFDP
jgi:hypothetical protein